ncbi:hypothetical protein GJU43_14905 [Flavobacterium sp. LC2016-23]|uniref:hypothetical protein n=1 Tax=Flavobacterium sp. LC2016-23 TaxID=2666330 RepID=UPI0012B0B5AE|nr:hypothetical protein [Flavobacterium sp. LC2016-23]MRX40576.1 hypothetical protein [Flavobacterium sp. LC2016-23]
MRSLGLLLIEVLLLIIGGSIFLLLFVVGCLYTFCKHVVKFDYSSKRQLQPIIRSVTLSLDGLACAGGGELLNDALRINGKIKYGKWNKSISGISGLVKIYEKDTWLRRFLDRCLGKNHCDESISDEDRFYYKNN